MLITPDLHLVIARLNPLLHWLSGPAARWVIIGLYAALLFGIHLHQGIFDGKEALKYMGCAEQVLQGDFHDLLGNYLKYASYVLYLVPFIAVGLPKAAILGQIMLSLMASSALRRMVLRSTGQAGVAAAASALFLLTPFIQQWTVAFYTESFFTSVSILFVERTWSSRKRDPWTIVLGLVTLFARPVGLFLVGALITWKITASIQGTSQSWFRLAGCCVLFGSAISIPGIRPAQLEPIIQGQVIAGVGGLGTPDASFSGSSILSAQRFLVERTSIMEWAEISGRRITSLYTTTRPYYSTSHNALNALLYLLYPLALIGAWTQPGDQLTRLLLAILLLNTALIGLTHDEWSGRFLVPLLPWVIVLAAMGLTQNSKSNSTESNVA